MTSQARASALLSQILDAVEALGCEVEPCDDYAVRVDGKRVLISAYATEGGSVSLYLPAIRFSEKHRHHHSFSFDESLGDDLSALDVADLALAIKRCAEHERSRRP